MHKISANDISHNIIKLLQLGWAKVAKGSRIQYEQATLNTVIMNWLGSPVRGQWLLCVNTVPHLCFCLRCLPMFVCRCFQRKEVEACYNRCTRWCWNSLTCPSPKLTVCGIIKPLQDRVTKCTVFTAYPGCPGFLFMKWCKCHCHCHWNE